MFLYIVAVLGDTPVSHGSRRRGSIPRVTTNGHCGNVKGGMSEWEGASLLRRGKMATEWAQQFYSSTHWQKCRDGFIAYKRGLCERCLAKGIIKAGRDVHHKIHLTPQNITDPAIALSWDNLELLCKECHEEEHRQKDWKKMQQQKKAKRQAKRQSKRRYDVDSFGRVKAKTEEETTRV